MRKFREGEHRERAGSGEPFNGSGAVRIVQTDPDSGIMQDEVDLFSSKKIVERQHDPASPDDAEIGRDVIRRVMTEERTGSPGFIPRLISSDANTVARRSISW